jgi:hypothetical protein
MGLLGGWIAENETIFFYSGKITRCDVALDFPGYLLGSVLVRARRLQKHGIYSDRRDEPETTYIGTPRGRRVVAYDKPDQSGGTNLRLECRLKPKILGHQLVNLANPFSRVQLLPADLRQVRHPPTGRRCSRSQDRSGRGGHNAVDQMLRRVTRYAEMSCSICRDMSTTWRLLLKCGSISTRRCRKISPDTRRKKRKQHRGEKPAGKVSGSGE